MKKHFINFTSNNKTMYFANNKFLLSVLFNFIFIYSFSQYNFQKTYKGLTINTGQITADGGYIATGSTKAYGAGSDDFFLLKLNPLGITEWLKTYGSNSKDVAYDLRQTYDGGYIVSGTTYGFGLGADFYIVKTDSNGDTIWTRTYGSTNAEMGFSVEQTLDSGFILVGQTQLSLYKDILIIKINKSGTLQWSKTFGGIKDEYAYNIKKTKDNNFIIIGATVSFGPAPGENLLLIKINNDGDTLWSKAYSCYQEEWGQNLIETSEGGLILVSTIWGFGAGAFDIFILKTDSTGEVIWAKTYGTSLDEYSQSIFQTSDGGFILTGGSKSDTGSTGHDVYTIRLTSFGDTLWSRLYPRNTEADGGTAVVQIADGGFIIFAASSNYSSTSNFFSHLIKTDKDGNTVCNSSYYKTFINNAPTTIYSAPGIISNIGSEKKIPTIIKDTTILDSVLCLRCGSITINYDSIICKDDTTEITLNTAVNSSYSWSPDEKLSCSDCPNPEANPDSSSFFFVTVKDMYGCETADSIFITVDSCPKEFLIPNIFSPNNDGINDYFVINGIALTGWILFIFNRWGELLYETEIPAEKFWDGKTLKGTEASQGVYYYILKNESLNFVFNGNIQLVR